MDYIGEKCPVCGKNFHANDDIVVCPICGTPHHRECYENLGHCFNESKHAEGFSYDQVSGKHTEENGGFIICKKCGKHNPQGTFFCGNCGEPLGDNVHNNFNGNGGGNPYGNKNPYGGNPYGGQQQPGGFGGMPPFGMPPMGAVPFDPLGGMNPDEVIEDGVTVGETAKYVKSNSFYFLNVFKNIKAMGRTKFNFAAFLFSGGYLLYRKMYKIGSIVCAINFLLILASTIISYSDPYIYVLGQLGILSSSTQSNIIYYTQSVFQLPFPQMMIFLAPMILSLINFVINIIVGFNANKLYYKHCMKNISKIKKESSSVDDSNAKLQTMGGVNTPIAFTLLIVLFLINTIPYIMLL